MLERRHFRPRNVAADEGRDRPHHDGNGDNDGGEDDHALQDRRVKPDIFVIVVIVVVFAHHIRLRFSQRTGVVYGPFGRAYPAASPFHGEIATAPLAAFYAPAFFNFSATLAAKYVRTPSAPARLNAIRLSIIALSRSSQPFPAAAIIIAYSPET